MRGTLRGRLAVIVATLLILLLTVAGSTLFVRLRVGATDHALEQVWTPARAAAASLSTAYIDQETGERGFLLTGEESFLQPYERGQAEVVRVTGQLGALLAGDPAGLRLLSAAAAAGDTWTTVAAVPEIAARRSGTPPGPDVLIPQATQARRLFDVLRGRLSALSDHISERTAAELRKSHSAQTVANWISVGAMGLALLVTAGALAVLSRSVRRPVSRMLEQVEAVAGGKLDQPVEAGGPAEVAAVARAVEAMRLRIQSDMQSAADAQERLAILEEAERIARDLHDLVIQRLFAAGMQLESVASRHPASADSVHQVVDELDRTIRDLRSVIFGLTTHQATGQLRERVVTLVRESQGSLGFLPRLHLEGPLDSTTNKAVADELVPALAEMLSNVARHAAARTVDVRVSLDEGMLNLVVVDDGVGLPAELDGGGRGLRNLRERAVRLGGWCRLEAQAGGGTVVEWSVPVG